MKKYGNSGFKISSHDKLALDHYLAVTPQEWAMGALKGMINKAVKTIIKDYLPIYREKNATFSSDREVLIPALVGLEEFKPYHYDIPQSDKEQAIRKDPRNDEVWLGGMDIEDYEDIALHAFYEDPEATLYYLMENKIAKRKNAFSKEHSTKFLQDPEIHSLPSHVDDLIDFAVARPGYKNRKQRDLEEFGGV